MHKTSNVLTPISLILLFVTLTAGISKSGMYTSKNSPREDDLQLFFYSDVLATYAALEAGEIDIVGCEIVEPIYVDAISNPQIVLAPVSALDVFEFDLNNNYTIASYPDIRSPTNYREFRQALAFLTDKDLVVDTFCGGFATRIDQPIAAPTSGWMNTSYSGTNYPYEYDPAAASALLDAYGWINGSTPNPYYDPAFPGSTTTIRTYPPGHSKAGLDLDDVVFYVRSDDPRRFQAGRHLYENVEKIGIPVDANEGPGSFTHVPVNDMRDYHVYTGGWHVGQYPIYLYTMFHSSFWFPRGSNYVTGMNASNLPNYPSLDNLLYELRHSKANEEAISSCKIALGYFTELCVKIPLWSSLSYWAYSSSLLGVVNMEGKGLENGYSFMNAYKSDGSPIRIGTVAPPNDINILHSSCYSAYQNLDRMNLYGGLETAPYDLSVDQAGFVRDWETTTWLDAGDGENKTKLTVWFRDDAYFVEPLTGNQKAQVNATHFAFSAWYEYATVDSWHYPKWENVHHIDVIDPFTVNIYFDSLSCWNIYYANGPILPIDTWLQPPLAYQVTENFTEGVDTTTPGVIGLSGVPVWINSVTADGAPLTMFTDYNIIKGQLEILTALPPGTFIEVSYWYVGDSQGFTPGNLPMETIFEGAGMYYATSFTPGAGGYLTLKANPFFWLETPPLGEVDWKCYWQGTVKPRNGYFHVNDADLDMVEAALGSSGTSTPDVNWNPGCDLAEPAGYVDAIDFALVQGMLGTTFGWSDEVAGVPIAIFSFQYDSPTNDHNVHFDASDSFHTDSNRRIVSWDWDFGDGKFGSGVTITHFYTQSTPPTKPPYEVKLKVTDDIGQEDWETSVVTVGNLVAGEIEAVQVVFGARLVENKPTVFRLKCSSTFDEKVTADIRIFLRDFEREKEVFEYELHPGENEFILPPRSESTFTPNKGLDGSCGYDFRIEKPRDSSGLIKETFDNDNISPNFSESVVTTRQLKIVYVPICAEKDSVKERISYEQVLRFADQVDRFMKMVYPIEKVSSHTVLMPSPVSIVKKPNNFVDVDKTISNIGSKISSHAYVGGPIFGWPKDQFYDFAVGVVPTDWIRTRLDNLGRTIQAGIVKGFVEGEGGTSIWAIVEVGTEYTTAAHELGHLLGLDDDYKCKSVGFGSTAEGLWVDQRRVINVVNDKGIVVSHTADHQNCDVYETDKTIYRTFMHYGGTIYNRWVDVHDYEQILERLREKNDPEVLMVRGWLHKNGSASFSDTLYHGEGIEDLEGNSIGDYHIVLLNESGVIYQTGFNMTYQILADPPIKSNETTFSFRIPWFNSTCAIELRDSLENVLATKTVTPNPPVVNIGFPNGGEEIIPETNYTIAWTASDLDGDNLTYNVLISNDGGFTWIPIRTEIKEENISYNFMNLPGGDHYLIKVIAGDGVNVGEDSSDYYFTVSSFTIDLVEATQDVVAMGKVTYAINISSCGGFSDPIFLNVSSSSSDSLIFHWVTGPIVVPPWNGSTTVFLEVEATNLSAAGPYYIFIKATSGNNTQLATAELFVIVHDVAVIQVEPSRNIVGVGYSVFISAVIQNRGFYLESCSISLFCNQSEITNQTVYLHAGASQTLVFEWNTDGFVKGNYTIIVQVDPVQNETLTTDNTATNGPLFLTIHGDVDGNSEVDIFDIVAIAGAYGSEEGDPTYNPNYDIDGDGDVDIFDIVAAAGHYGESW